MKNNYIFFLGIFLLISGLVVGCLKKSEEDPFISLRSRNSRIVGDWKLIKFESEKSSKYTSNYTEGPFENITKTTATFDGISLTEIVERTYMTQVKTPVYNSSGDLTGYNWVNTPADTTITTVFDHSYLLTIREDGTSSIEKKITQTSPVAAATITNLYSGDWNWRDSKKKKTAIALLMPPDNYFDIIRLSNKELILEYDFLEESIGSYSQSEKTRLEFAKN